MYESNEDYIAHSRSRYSSTKQVGRGGEDKESGEGKMWLTKIRGANRKCFQGISCVRHLSERSTERGNFFKKQKFQKFEVMEEGGVLYVETGQRGSPELAFSHLKKTLEKEGVFQKFRERKGGYTKPSKIRYESKTLSKRRNERNYVNQLIREALIQRSEGY